MGTAVIGGGFAGLAIAWHLLQKGRAVTLFDHKGIGGGASGIATGLLHPYLGEQGRLSWRGHEALVAAKELIGVAETALGHSVITGEGILRLVTTEGQAQLFRHYSDVRTISEDRFLIECGMTIDAPLYLEGLFAACKGIRYERQRIKGLEELSHYQYVVIAAGAGSFDLTQVRANRVKGQILICNFKEEIPYSLIGKGYVAKAKNGYILGSTYEREDLSDVPDIKRAENELLPKGRELVQQEPEVRGCKAAVRVTPIGHYKPIVARVNERTWVFTGLGSRGLLYHSLLGKELSEQMED